MGEQLTFGGEFFRNAGVDSVSANTPDEWKLACDLAIAKLAATHQPFTAEDVRAVVGGPPNHPNAMGARFLAAAKTGTLEKLGYRNPARPSSHSSVIAVWRGKAVD